MFRTHSFVLLALMALLVLTQCTSAPDRSTKDPAEAVDVADQELSLTEEKSAGDWLQEADAAANEVEQHSALIRAANAFQNEQQWQQAAAILSQLAPKKITHHSQKYYRLAKARWAAEQKVWAKVIEELEDVATQFNQREFRVLSLQLLSQAAYQQQDYWQSLVWQVDAQRFAEQRNTDTVWSIARRIKQSELPQQRPNDLALAGWWRLVDYHHQAMTHPDSLTSFLNQWQQSFPNHDAATLVDIWLEPPLKPSESEPEAEQASPEPTLAVLLPLSGRYKQQGQAVRDGVIARTGEMKNLRVVFIDSEASDIESQQKQIEELSPVGIIGPLLKDKVAAWSAHPITGIPQVYLNQIDDEAAQNSLTNVFFALSPESEAQQAAQKINQQFPSSKSALVITADGSSGRRMVDAFTSSWENEQAEQPTISYFSEREDMKTTVERSLGLTDSQQRIRVVKIAAGKIIVDEQERSRRDISAIYLPGNLQQTRLLKPFIDVSVSPFAEPIPVYASSATHELRNRLGDSDLNGIIFSDVPWLIESSGKNILLSQWLELRNGWGLSLARLTAMGYDSVSLIQRLEMMNRMPGLVWSGLSGELHIDNSVVQRKLIWATFSKGEITLAKEADNAGSRYR
ncbi:penicillin-binding protein activator [Idiomarina loihiensis]|uniref:penicillin-binding protein activator n=1 Tax=Idiomarina loihiensis TaxID=135577 RepID=UPI00130ACDA0|nr:penicillin-binding protein activator [Idiomarina loihiensis]MRJ45281.1 penicillin-binding protein activator [Idiomarina loihiensis]UTW32246.1 penicillin-binding protein activator [Idiomarina loihiensis]